MDEIIGVNNDKRLKLDSNYSETPTKLFKKLPKVAMPLIKEAEITLSKIEELLYSTPAFINVIKASLPEVSLQAVLSDEQKQKLAEGALKLMTKKDGSLMATLINPKTKKMVANIPLENVITVPELNQSLIGFAAQMQMA